MDSAFHGYAAFLAVVRWMLFGVAVLAGLIALLDWLVRTRRVPPFSAVARFCRRYIDPLMLPIERRIVRSGGQPASAPWWTLVVVVVGGLLLLAVLNFLQGFFRDATFAISSPGRFAKQLLAWAFAVLRIALIVRVISSWFQISPYSKWIRWSYHLTEWMLAPLRRVLPTFGPIDISPLIAFVLLAIIEGVLIR